MKKYINFVVVIVSVAGVAQSVGVWCSDNGGSRFCRTGCCGTYWNRTCCPVTQPTRSPFNNTTYALNNITQRGVWCNESTGSRYCRTGCCGTYENRFCCPVTNGPTTKYPTTNYQTRRPEWSAWATDSPSKGTWCSHRGGSMYCRYGCCGTYYNRYCCSATEKPDTITESPSVVRAGVGRIIIVVVSCLAAFIGVVTIITGVCCCLRTGQRVRGQTGNPVMTSGTTNIQSGSQLAGQPTYVSVPHSSSHPPTQPQNPTAIDNQVYFTGSSDAIIINQNYSPGYQNQAQSSRQPQPFQAP